MFRMTMLSRLLVALSIVVCSGSHAVAADLVRFQLKSGETITGELLDPSKDGDYRVQVGERVVEIGHDEVFTTIDVGADDAPTSKVAPKTFGVTARDVLRSLQQRLPLLQVSAESSRLFRTCLAEATRGDWDYAIRSAERLFEIEPTWVEPQVLRALLLSERGQKEPAIALALWIESMAPEDALALRVSAICYRRGSFSRRAVETLARVADAEYPADRALYERVRLWWPVDAAYAAQCWQQYLKRDPLLRQPWCDEGRVLHRAELALARSDWEAAQAAIDEISANYPWARRSVEAVELRVVERRLRESEAAGRVEESLIAIDTLAALDETRESEWQARRVALVEHHLRRGLATDEFIALRLWATRSAAIYRDNEDASARISARFQQLACELASRSKLELAEHAFHEADRWDSMARPAQLDGWLGAVIDRARVDVSMRRTLRVLRLAEVLRDAYPERRESLLDTFTALCRDELRDVATVDEVATRLSELRGVFLRRRPGSPRDGIGPDKGIADGTVEATEDDTLRLTSLAYPSISRYFPHEIGSRWIYELEDGRREEHEVVRLTPLGNGGWKVDFQVRPENSPGGFTRTAFIAAGDLRNGFATSPPAEVALRYPLSHGAKWSWKKANLEFKREISRPADSLVLPGGVVEDYLVVDAVNTIRADRDREFTTWQRVYYAANVGIVKIESEDESLSKVLVEYIAAKESPRTAQADSARD